MQFLQTHRMGGTDFMDLFVVWSWRIRNHGWECWEIPPFPQELEASREGFFLEVDGMTGSYIINHDHTCLAGSQVATPGVAGDSPLGSEAFGEVMEARLFF